MKENDNESKKIYIISDMVKNSASKEKIFVIYTFILYWTSVAGVLPG